MRIGRMKNEDEASDYILERLKEVKEILDDIADQTGVVFICFSEPFAQMFGECGAKMIVGLQSIMKIIPDRFDIANNAVEYARQMDKKDEELKAEMEKHEQACPENQEKPCP